MKHAAPNEIPEADRFYYLEERYPRFGNLVPRDVAARNAKDVCDKGLGVGPTGYGVYLDFRDAIKKHGHDVIQSRYDNLFEMYERITDESPYEVPMRIYPAVHYTMGGLWVDYNLMTNCAGAVCDRRSKFCRSRRQPAGGQFADAMPGRWLLHHSGHDW